VFNLSVVTAYDYDPKGRLISKVVRLKTDTVDSDSNLVSYGSNAPKTKTEYTYDRMDRLLTKKLGDGSTQNLVLFRWSTRTPTPTTASGRIATWWSPTTWCSATIRIPG
jgi:YD repeat-containing protein